MLFGWFCLGGFCHFTVIHDLLLAKRQPLISSNHNIFACFAIISLWQIDFQTPQLLYWSLWERLTRHRTDSHILSNKLSQYLFIFSIFFFHLLCFNLGISACCIVIFKFVVKSLCLFICFCHAKIIWFHRSNVVIGVSLYERIIATRDGISVKWHVI